ncbi:Ger(x)C family spore germination protein [Paenibacillus thalictri]|uniref:Ger(X)C family spore germination protein n=1 Tax=Paenibacillus thalictri TaxID=2527873 RepID=A0A4Q9DTL7_9BACL|nr:Ger(x)C family spore germination protein [Paenibacillus thalictri]TBL80283.1 Ger(x)C family spore germination protein [Paenibacillus thalictri]
MKTGISRITRHILIVISFCVMGPLLAGCWDRTEVNDLALIMAAGLDKKSDNTIELAVEVFVPKGASSGGMQGGGGAGSTSGAGQTLVRSAYGITLADAMAKLQEEFPRRIFWGHCEVFIFGEKLAKDGMRDHMDFIMREPGPRERANVFISKGNARDILQLIPPLERSSAEVLREMAKLQTGMKVTVKDFSEMLIGDSKAAALPWVEMVPAEPFKKPNETVGFINGTAIIKGDRMVGLLNDKLTRGLLWLRDEIKTSIVTITPKETKGHVSMKLLKSQTNLIPSINGDKWSVTVKIETEDDVMQNTTNLDLTNPKLSDSLEKQLAEDIERRIKDALVQPQKELNADIFDFAEAFHRKYPKEWRKAKARWDELFPKVEVKIEAKAKIMRTGMATVGASLPDSEVKKK